MERAESYPKGRMCKRRKRITTWKVKRESCEMNPSEPHCTYPNKPSMPAKMSTLKDKILKFYVICRNHKLSFIRTETSSIFVSLEQPLNSLL